MLPLTHKVDKFQLDHYCATLQTECNRFLGIHRLVPPPPRRQPRLNGCFAALASPYPNCLVEGYYEYLPVTDTPRLCTLFDGVDDLGHHVVCYDNFQFYLGNEVDDVRRATVDFFFSARAAKSLHLRHSHALDANF